MRLCLATARRGTGAGYCLVGNELSVLVRTWFVQELNQQRHLKEAKEYFAALDDHRKTFVWEGVLFSTDAQRCCVQTKLCLATAMRSTGASYC
jgi:hypothetical protein